ERFVGDGIIDLFEFQIALEPPPADRTLLDFRRRVTESKALVVKIAILAETRDHRLDNSGLISLDALDVFPLHQSLPQLGDRPWFRRQKLDGARKSLAAKFV